MGFMCASFRRLSIGPWFTVILNYNTKNIVKFFWVNGPAGNLIIFLDVPRIGVLGYVQQELPRSDLKNASVQQPPFPCNDPLLFVIPSETEGSAVPRGPLLETRDDNGEVGASMRIR
jgi:hypothetical protein